MRGLALLLPVLVTISVSVAAASVAPTTQPGAELVARWEFAALTTGRSTVVEMDSSPSGLPGRLNPGAVSAEGPNGMSALHFDGKGGVVTVGNDLRTALTGDLTFMAWVKTEAKHAEVLLSRHEGSDKEQGYILKLTEKGYLAMRLGGDNNRSGWPREVIDGANAVNDGQWHHVAVIVRLGLDVQFYVDGGLSSMQAASRWPGARRPRSLSAARARRASSTAASPTCACTAASFRRRRSPGFTASP
jgi:hypothetical protein